MGAPQAEIGGTLRLMEAKNAGVGQFEGLPQRHRQGLPGLPQPGFRNPQGIRANTIKSFAEAQQGSVPLQAHPLQKLGHLLLFLTDLGAFGAARDPPQSLGRRIRVPQAGEQGRLRGDPGGGLGSDHRQRARYGQAKGCSGQRGTREGEAFG